MPDDTTAPVTAEDPWEQLHERFKKTILDQAATWEETFDAGPGEVVSVSDAASVIARLLAGDPGDLPARMRDAAKRAFAGRPPMADGAYALDSGRNPWTALNDALDAAMSVRWEDHAATVARLAQAESRAEHAEGQLSALRDHRARWELEKARADKAEAELKRLHSWDGLLSLLDEHWPEDIFPTEPDSEDRDSGPRIVSLLRWVERLRAELAEARRELEATHVRAKTAVKRRNDVKAERDALKAAIERVRALDDIYPCGSVIAVPHGTGGWRDVLPVADLRAALAVPESNEDAPTREEDGNGA